MKTLRISLMTSLLLIACQSLFAYDFEKNGIYYNITSSTDMTVEVTKNEECPYSGNLSIPSLVTYMGEYYLVTSIGEHAFSACSNLTGIVIPNSVDCLDNWAFSGCSNLTDITIPPSVTKVGAWVFSGCSNLRTVTLYSSIKEISNCVFHNCPNLQCDYEYKNALYFGNPAEPYLVLVRATSKEITSCDVEEGCLLICDSAFSKCYNMEKITVPQSVLFIDQDAFYESAGDAYVNGNSFDSAESFPIGSLCGTKFRRIVLGDNVIKLKCNSLGRNSELVSVHIGRNIDEIDAFGLFAYDDSLKDIVVDANNATFDSRNECNAIIETSTSTLIAGCKNTIIPNDVINIGKWAFHHCEQLTTITLPQSIRNIEGSAFSGCSNLSVIINLAKEPQDIPISTFYGNKSDTLYVPISCKSAYEASPGWNYFKNIIEIDVNDDNGQENCRYWYFNSWGAETLANLKADESWSLDVSETESEGCFYYLGEIGEDGKLMANGQPVKETIGLSFIVSQRSKQIAISTDYGIPCGANYSGTFYGSQYLWLNSSAIKICIPNLKPGDKITAGIESHKIEATRGLDMYIGNNKITWDKDEQGKPANYPTTYAEYTWTIPYNIETSSVDVVFKSSSGCHLYFLSINNARPKIPSPAPFISQKHKNGSTLVSIYSSADKVYYTTDGTEPNELSTIYKGPFEVSKDGLCVKAFSTKENCEPSDISVDTVSVMVNNSEPFITVNVDKLNIFGEGTIYYNLNGTSDKELSNVYSGEIILPDNLTIYAFSERDGYLPSDVVSASVCALPFRKDTLSVFNPNETDWFDKVVIKDCRKNPIEKPTSNWDKNAAYYFGKSSWSYYSDEVDHIEHYYEEDGTTPLKCVDGVTDSTKIIYKPDPLSLKYVYSTSALDWYLSSQGQIVVGETALNPFPAIGNGRTGRYADSEEDLIGCPTAGIVEFLGRANGEPYSAAITSTGKHSGPFDIVAYVGNGNTNTSVSPIVVVEVSADGEVWERLDTLQFSSTPRYYKKNIVPYSKSKSVYVRLSHIGGSSRAQVYDIYLIRNTPLVNAHLVKYVIDGDVYRTYYAEPNSAIPQLQNPTKEGYVFTGWENVPEKMPNGDLTIIGHFEEISLSISDGTVYDNIRTKTIDVSYSRTFGNTHWQALYVPFSIPVDSLSKYGLQVAELNDTHQWDFDGDGVADSTRVEFFTLTSGSTEANYPYLIRATEPTTLSLTLKDIEVKAAEENSIECSSTKQKFTFVGTYTGVSGADMYDNNYYGMSGGGLKRVSSPSVSLKPQRWYMKIENKNGSPVNYFAPSIRFTVDGIDEEEEETSAIVDMCTESRNRHKAFYSLEGIRQHTAPTQRGMYVLQDKKLIIR